MLLLFVRSTHLVGWWKVNVDSSSNIFNMRLPIREGTRAVASPMCHLSKDPITWLRAMWVRDASARNRKKGIIIIILSPRAQRPLAAKGMDFLGGIMATKRGCSREFEALLSACQIVSERLIKCVQPVQKNKAELMPFMQLFFKSPLEWHLMQP